VERDSGGTIPDAEAFCLPLDSAPAIGGARAQHGGDFVDEQRNFGLLMVGVLGSMLSDIQAQRCGEARRSGHKQESGSTYSRSWRAGLGLILGCLLLFCGRPLASRETVGRRVRGERVRRSAEWRAGRCGWQSIEGRALLRKE